MMCLACYTFSHLRWYVSQVRFEILKIMFNFQIIVHIKKINFLTQVPNALEH